MLNFNELTTDDDSDEHLYAQVTEEGRNFIELKRLDNATAQQARPGITPAPPNSEIMGEGGSIQRLCDQLDSDEVAGAGNRLFEDAPETGLAKKR